MNEIACLYLRDCMSRPEGWGRPEGRVVFPALLNAVEAHPGVTVFRVSLQRVERIDISFASETVVQLSKRYRGNKGFCLVDLANDDIVENIDAAARKGEYPVLAWYDARAAVLGPKPSQGLAAAFEFALRRPSVTVADFVTSKPDISVTNASNKFKQLWQQGYLLRRERAADTGGVEYVYYRIG